MRRLMLFRHAKAERLPPGGRDHERTLDARGRADALKLGATIVQLGLVPDRAIVSTAARTRETWALAAGVFASAPPVEYDERLYDATPGAILHLIQPADPATGTLLLVGHNPGMHELAAIMTSEADNDRLNDFPTAALAVIDFPLEAWSRLQPRSGRLVRFVTPQILAATD